MSFKIHENHGRIRVRTHVAAGDDSPNTDITGPYEEITIRVGKNEVMISRTLPPRLPDRPGGVLLSYLPIHQNQFAVVDINVTTADDLKATVEAIIEEDERNIEAITPIGVDAAEKIRSLFNPDPDQLRMNLEHESLKTTEKYLRREDQQD